MKTNKTLQNYQKDKSFLRQLTMTTNGYLFPLNLFVVQCISCITRMITCASLKNLSNLYSIHWHSIWISFWIKVLIKQNVWSLCYNSFDSSRLIVDVIDSLRLPCFFFKFFYQSQCTVIEKNAVLLFFLFSYSDLFATKLFSFDLINNLNLFNRSDIPNTSLQTKLNFTVTTSINNSCAFKNSHKLSPKFPIPQPVYEWVDYSGSHCQKGVQFVSKCR